MIIRSIAAIIISFTICTNSAFSAEVYETDPAKLTEQKRQLFFVARKKLDEWTGQYKDLAEIGSKIDSFIGADPNFLPIYIEKARFIIMTGFSGKNDYEKFNKEALNILKEVSRKDPLYPKAYVLAGHAYLNIGDYSNARKSLGNPPIFSSDQK